MHTDGVTKPGISATMITGLIARYSDCRRAAQ
jgi:hypothetical protein